MNKKTIKLKRIDLKKSIRGDGGSCCEHPDISEEKTYMVKYSGAWIVGEFGRQWYGWNFNWFGSVYAGLQLDSLDEVWEIDTKL